MEHPRTSGSGSTPAVSAPAHFPLSLELEERLTQPVVVDGEPLTKTRPCQGRGLTEHLQDLRFKATGALDELCPWTSPHRPVNGGLPRGEGVGRHGLRGRRRAPTGSSFARRAT